MMDGAENTCLLSYIYTYIYTLFICLTFFLAGLLGGILCLAGELEVKVVLRRPHSSFER